MLRDLAPKAAVVITAASIGTMLLSGCTDARDQDPLGIYNGYISVSDGAIPRTDQRATDPDGPDATIGNIADTKGATVTGMYKPVIFPGVSRIGNVACTPDPFTNKTGGMLCVPTEQTSIASRSVDNSMLIPYDPNSKPMVTLRPKPDQTKG